MANGNKLNKPLTVYDLYRYCEGCMNEGLADNYVYISDDEEGNGFHPLFWGFESRPEMINKYNEYGVNGLHGVDAENIVLLG